jgi:hypothetical protein
MSQRRRKNGTFTIGSIPWNKDMKGIHLSKSGQFKKGIIPKNKLKVGAVTIRIRKEQGPRAFVKTAEPNTWERRARIVWQKFRGPVPHGFIIHHIDGNSLNDKISNLRLVNRHEHLRLHRDAFATERLSGLRKAAKVRWERYRRLHKRRKCETHQETPAPGA